MPMARVLERKAVRLAPGVALLLRLQWRTSSPVRSSRLTQELDPPALNLSSRPGRLAFKGMCETRCRLKQLSSRIPLRVDARWDQGRADKPNAFSHRWNCGEGQRHDLRKTCNNAQYSYLQSLIVRSSPFLKETHHEKPRSAFGSPRVFGRIYASSGPNLRFPRIQSDADIRRERSQPHDACREICAPQWLHKNRFPGNRPDAGCVRGGQ